MLDFVNLDRLSEADLQALIDVGATESREIDFKRDTYGHSDADKREFLADISAFANTSGGHLVIGMDENAGTATALVGIEVNPDEERLRLEQIARTGLQPRISGIRIATALLANGSYAIIIRIPRSWAAPHRVIAQGSNKFWARDASGKYEPDVDQLRMLFEVAPGLADRIRNFRSDRIARIWANDTPVPLQDGTSALIIHVLPYLSFASHMQLSIDNLYQAQQHLRPITTSGYTPRINLDGFLTTSPGSGPAVSYTQVWRNGSIETVRSPQVRENDGARVVYSGVVEKQIVDAVRNHLIGLEQLQIGPPYAILVSLTGVKGATLDRHDYDFDDDAYSCDRMIIHTSEVIISELLTADDVPRLMRPAFNEIANAFGRSKSRHFGSNGVWRRPQ